MENVDEAPGRFIPVSGHVFVYDLICASDSNINAAAEDRILHIGSKGEVTLVLQGDFSGDRKRSHCAALRHAQQRVDDIARGLIPKHALTVDPGTVH